MAKKGVPPVPILNRNLFYGTSHPDNPIPPSFPAIDNDLASENLANDLGLTAADLKDL